MGLIEWLLFSVGGYRHGHESPKEPQWEARCQHNPSPSVQEVSQRADQRQQQRLQDDVSGREVAPQVTARVT